MSTERSSGARTARAPRRLTSFLPVTLAALLATGVARAERSDLTPAVGFNYNEVETPRIAGMAGALRASSSSLHALFINPANLAATRVYHIGALAQIWPEAHRQSYGAAAVDSVVSSARLAGGIGGTFNLQDTDDDGIDRRWTDLRFALAYPVSDEFFLGAGGRYLWLSEDGLGPLGASRASSGLTDQRIVKAMTFDAGVTLKPMPELSLALVGNNLTSPGYGYHPTSVGGGLALALGDFNLEGDLVADFTTWDTTTVRGMGGAEGLFADHLAVRIGYRYDQGADSHALAGGIGYIDRAFDADVSVRRVVAGETATAIVLGFSYHLEASGLTPSPADTF